MSLLPLNSARVQAAVVALAIILCGFLLWTTVSDGRGFDPVTTVAGGSPSSTPPAKPADVPSNAPSSAAPDPAPTTIAPKPLPGDPPPVPAFLQAKAGMTDGGKWVALTIDDGPNPRYTGPMLDLFKEEGIKATFCVLGQQVREQPALLKRIVDEGHTLCNHTMSHDTKLKEKSPEVIQAEMKETLDLIQQAVPGAQVPWFRAPGGNWSQPLQDAAARLGMRSLHWTADTNDWKKPGAQKMIDDVHKAIGPNGVILAHDGGDDRTQTLEALRRLIPDLKAKGYKFCIPHGGAA